MLGQMFPQRHRRPLVEKNTHGLSGGETRFRKFQDGENLCARHAGKPLQKLVDRRALLEILE